MLDEDVSNLLKQLTRIADALERANEHLDRTYVVGTPTLANQIGKA